ncbi:hypothetical protein Clacol_006213 [Clathrus columnatus]|uniref:Protein kinase domain-containing protein n=1 Tax=Clathrus columnatus TaxID=1419009 RepID=A0AAV5AGE7_9AGAM|nr:hypothetical protein Clacol_006213 [Clathrus columnatus]
MQTRAREQSHQVLPNFPLALNWLLVHRGKATEPDVVSFTHTQYTGPSRFCREMFTSLLKEHLFDPDIDTINFWVPKDPIILTAPDNKNWKDVIGDFERSFTSISPALPLSKSDALNRINNNNSLIHLVLTVKPISVIINWLFYRSNDSNPVFSTEISYSSFITEIERCREHFTTKLYDRLGIRAKSETLEFYQPKDPMFLKAEIGPEFEERLEMIVTSCILSDALQRDFDHANRIHLVVTAPLVHPEERDKVSALSGYEPPLRPLYSNYKKIMETKGKPPSEGSKSTNYIDVQKSEGQMIYDGRHPPGTKTRLIAPTIQIFHPVFNRFLHILHDSEIQPSNSDLSRTQDLMWNLTKISTDEDERNGPIRESLSKLLDYPVRYESRDSVKADAVCFFPPNQPNCPIFIGELKREIGEGGSDPSTQVGIFMRRYWRTVNESIRDKCCCPTFLLAAAGPWVCVLGAVITDKVIVQRLTGLYWMGLSTTEEDGRVYESSRVFMALRESLKELKLFYQEVVKFQYQRPLESDSACVTFQAVIIDGQDPIPGTPVVIKFVARYGEDAHRFLADAGHAPRLYYYGPVSDATLYKGVGALASKAHPGLCLRREIMHMAVMAYIHPSPGVEFPADAREQVEAILVKLHSKGFVFGDLRGPNILADANGQVYLIDFNWCGRYDVTMPEKGLPSGIEDAIKDIEPYEGPFATYPLSISTTIDWPGGVKALEPIRPSHDWQMFNELSL